MPGSTLPSAANKQLYNGGSEWQNDFANLPDLYETHYRNYDPTLGRFVSVDPLAEASESLTSYQYAFNNPLMFNDPLGDLARDYAGRSGPGSGKHWSDGIYNSDWSLWDGSTSYKGGIAQGFTDWGGNLYNNYSKAEKIIYNRTNNEYGYFTYGPGGVTHSYKEESTFLNRYINYSPGTLGTWHEVSFPNANKGGEAGFLEANWKDMAFMANDLAQAYIGANTTLKASSGYRLAQTTVQLPLGLATRTSTRALSTISKVGGGIAKAAPWVAGGAIVVDVVSNKQINAGHVYQGVVTGLSFIPGAGLVVGGGALALEGISYYYTGKSVSDNINQGLNGGVIYNLK